MIVWTGIYQVAWLLWMEQDVAAWSAALVHYQVTSTKPIMRLPQVVQSRLPEAAGPPPVQLCWHDRQQKNFETHHECGSCGKCRSVSSSSMCVPSYNASIQTCPSEKMRSASFVRLVRCRAVCPLYMYTASDQTHICMWICCNFVHVICGSIRMQIITRCL